MSELTPPDAFLASVETARKQIRGLARRTPVEYSEDLSRALGVPVHLKLEMLQVTGSFKLRGALHRVLSLGQDETTRGIVTCSAGNHGWAVAWAAGRVGVPATVYLPSTADPGKVEAIRRLGAEVVIPGPTGFDDVEPLAMEYAARAGRPYLSAFDDDWVMAGNGGTLAAEVLEDLPDTYCWLLPVGGGGLAAGTVRYLRASNRPFRLVGCQLAESPSLQLSLQSGRAVTRMPSIDTWAGGLEGGIGARTFHHLREQVHRVALLNEEELRSAMIWLLGRHHYLAEPSGLAGIAACVTGKCGPQKGPAVVVVTGRNFALERLSRWLSAP